MGSQSIPVLRDVAFEIHSGKTCAMLGASGSGESTLLNLVWCGCTFRGGRVLG
ncbi:ATP-binding cassette domain-containing protein [Achromobacter xylosoxidans]